jgi:hypothetical protein
LRRVGYSTCIRCPSLKLRDGTPHRNSKLRGAAECREASTHNEHLKTSERLAS